MGVYSIDQIILSCNEDPTYRDFWIPVSFAYKKMFPQVRIRLAFLTYRTESDPLVQLYRESGEVTLFHPVSIIPEFSQAKMIRFILASQQGDDICYIDDIDLFPLVREFITDKTIIRPPNKLMCVGGEVYQNIGSYPSSQLTAEGHIWKKFINPHDLSYEYLLKEWQDMPMQFDQREDMCIKTDWAKDDYFSDERLIRKLLHLYPVQRFELARGYDNYLDATIDRHTWNKQTQTWEFDKDKLKAGGYFNAHGIRPFNKFAGHYQPLIDYINDNY